MRTGLALMTIASLLVAGSAAAYAQSGAPASPSVSDAEKNAFESPTVGLDGPRQGAETGSQVNKSYPPMEPTELSPVEYLNPSNNREQEDSGKTR